MISKNVHIKINNWEFLKYRGSNQYLLISKLLCSTKKKKNPELNEAVFTFTFMTVLDHLYYKPWKRRGFSILKSWSRQLKWYQIWLNILYPFFLLDFQGVIHTFHNIIKPCGATESLVLLSTGLGMPTMDALKHCYLRF